ncbi:unnamed protein product [Arctia plantaginis]|uniref:CCR4-NOT transcription complex subunit 9 n=1 Tax=Arctia plantaginis TaxID=874455 RepID=A0A8S1BB68_ARCPL|nr:unnamed protein product [Arctia plantaginis]
MSISTGSPAWHAINNLLEYVTTEPGEHAVRGQRKDFTWILELCNPETRENALLELSKKRENVPDLAPMLWHSFGTIAALLQEITNIYVAMIPPTLTAHQSNREDNSTKHWLAQLIKNLEAQPTPASPAPQNMYKTR